MKNWFAVCLLTITILVSTAVGIKILKVENTKAVTEIVDKKIQLAKSRFQKRPVTATVIIVTFMASTGIWIFAIKMHAHYKQQLAELQEENEDLQQENRQQKVNIAYFQRQVKELIGMLLEYEKLLRIHNPALVQKQQEEPRIEEPVYATASVGGAKKATQKVAAVV